MPMTRLSELVSLPTSLQQPRLVSKQQLVVRTVQLHRVEHPTYPLQALVSIRDLVHFSPRARQALQPQLFLTRMVAPMHMQLSRQ